MAGVQHMLPSASLSQPQELKILQMVSCAEVCGCANAVTARCSQFLWPNAPVVHASHTHACELFSTRCLVIPALSCLFVGHTCRLPLDKEIARTGPSEAGSDGCTRCSHSCSPSCRFGDCELPCMEPVPNQYPSFLIFEWMCQWRVCSLNKLLLASCL
jgi:hypothetical protein